MNPFLQQMRNLGPARLAAMGGVAFGLIAFIIFFATRFSAPQMELLYGELSATDSREIVRQLEASGIPFRADENGAQIMVSSDRVTSVRMQMAEQGLPSGGSGRTRFIPRRKFAPSAKFEVDDEAGPNRPLTEEHSRAPWRA